MSLQLRLAASFKLSLAAKLFALVSCQERVESARFFVFVFFVSDLQRAYN